MMKLGTMQGLIAAALLLASAWLTAQEPAEDERPQDSAPAKKKAVEVEPRDISRLPEPLSPIRTNILDLPRQGYFVIEEVELRTRANGDEAIVWTVRVEKPVTCRHIAGMLREFRDARFIATFEKSRLEVLATLLHYSDRIALGASNNKLLRQDDIFELWIDLSTSDLQKLISLDADTLVLSRWRY